MDAKGMFAVMAALLLLLSPLLVAGEAEAEDSIKATAQPVTAADGSSAQAAPICPAKSPIKVRCNAFDNAAPSRQWVGADGCKYVCDDDAPISSNCPSKSPIKINCNAFDSDVREWVGADGCKYVCDDSQTVVACPTKSTIKVNCDSSDRAVRQWVGADGCKYECEYRAAAGPADCASETPICGKGFSIGTYVDANGCTVQYCKQDEPSKRVGISLLVHPPDVREGEMVKAVATVKFAPSPVAAADAAEKKFKVEIKMTGPGQELSAGRAKALLASATGEDALGLIKKSLRSILEQKKEGAKQDDNPKAASAAVADASIVASRKFEQEITEYITLKAGEEKSVVAYFAASSPGRRVIKAEAYELAGAACPAESTQPLPCKEEYKKVAQAWGYVRVGAQTTPPLPPIAKNNSTSSAVVGKLALSSGWNMVSLPVAAKVAMKQLQKECGSLPFAWRLTENGYVKEPVLVPGYGYWVRSAGSCEVDVSAESQVRELSPLFAGWNLVGAPGTAVPISDFAGSCNIVAGPWHYQNPSPSTSASPYVLASTLEPGKAYWIKVSGACRLGSAEEQPPAPPQ
ncbi:MAG: hypothetical protein N3E51_00725 [Candidatus Micrarchaeota archaeon]|nr:hypothetical protein [Candidatus Micrarchaeota archaeon]